MSMRTLTMDIHTSRVFIPSSTGFTRTSRTFGINAMGDFESWYNYFKVMGNIRDDKAYMRPFYDLLRAAYGARFSYPVKNPYVQYVDYMKSIGGGFSADDAAVIEHLREHCNTLIITDPAEFDYIWNEYQNLTMRDIGYVPFVHKQPIPARFAALQNTKAR